MSTVVNNENQEKKLTDIIEEIKEDIKQENNLKLWKKYGSIVISCCVVAVAATSVSVYLKNKRLNENQAQGNKLFSSLQLGDTGNTKEAVKSFNKLQDNSTPAIAAIATLRKGYLFEKEENFEQAMQAYLELSKNNVAPVELKELAELKYLNLAINLEKSSDLSDFDSKLKKLTQSGSIWRFSAIELAGFHAFANNKKDEAVNNFESLTKDKNTPPAVRQNAQNMLKILNK